MWWDCFSQLSPVKGGACLEKLRQLKSLSLGTGWWRKVFPSTLHCLHVPLSLASCLIDNPCFLPSAPRHTRAKFASSLLTPWALIYSPLAPAQPTGTAVLENWQEVTGWTYCNKRSCQKGFDHFDVYLEKPSSYIMVSHSHHLHKHWKLHMNYYYCFQLYMQFPERISFHWGWKHKLRCPECIKKTILVTPHHRKSSVFLNNYLLSSKTHILSCNSIPFFIVLPFPVQQPFRHFETGTFSFQLYHFLFKLNQPNSFSLSS